MLSLHINFILYHFDKTTKLAHGIQNSTELLIGKPLFKGGHLEQQFRCCLGCSIPYQSSWVNSEYDRSRTTFVSPPQEMVQNCLEMSQLLCHSSFMLQFLVVQPCYPHWFLCFVIMKSEAHRLERMS